MKRYTLRLKGRKILELSGQSNAHRLSLRAQVSYPTVDRYINRPETLSSYGCETLASILIDGTGKTPEEVLDMPMSEIFEIVEVED